MKKPPPLILADLEPWDRELVKAVAAGLDHAEMATHLGLRRQTVANRISMLGQRLKGVKGPTPTIRIIRWALLQKAGVLAK